MLIKESCHPPPSRPLSTDINSDTARPTPSCPSHLVGVVPDLRGCTHHQCGELSAWTLRTDSSLLSSRQGIRLACKGNDYLDNSTQSCDAGQLEVRGCWCRGREEGEGGMGREFCRIQLRSHQDVLMKTHI